MAIVKMKSVKNVYDYARYVLDQSRHKSEEIIEINDYKKNIDNQLHLIEEHKEQKKDKRGKPSKPLSIVIACPPNLDVQEVIKEHKRVLKGFYEFVNNENELGLNDEDIKKLIQSTASAMHYGKNSTGHTHNLINRVLWSRTANKLVSIDLSKKIYHRALIRLAGHTVSDEIQNKNGKSLYCFKLEQIEQTNEQIKQDLEGYRDLDDKLDEYILLALKDIKKGHSEKARTKLQKIKQQNKKRLKNEIS